MRPVRALAPCLALLAGLVLALAPVHAPRAGGHDGAIRAVIEDQLAAFRRGDLVAAFDHAAPSIRAMFGTPENFGRMVMTGYPMVWRPAGHRMLGLAETRQGPVQTVLFEDAQGRLHEADYHMVEIDGIWRIAGVYLREVPGVGT